MQGCGLVPIVEPEILIDGYHSLKESSEVAKLVLCQLFSKLRDKDVDLKGCLLKIQMIMPGSEAGKAGPEEIAQATLDVLTR